MEEGRYCAFHSGVSLCRLLSVGLLTKLTKPSKNWFHQLYPLQSPSIQIAVIPKSNQKNFFYFLNELYKGSFVLIYLNEWDISAGQWTHASYSSGRHVDRQSVTASVMNDQKRAKDNINKVAVLLQGINPLVWLSWATFFQAKTLRFCGFTFTPLYCLTCDMSSYGLEPYTKSKMIRSGWILWEIFTQHCHAKPTSAILYQLFRNVDVWLVLAYKAWWAKSDLEGGEDGCLWTIKQNKAIVVLAHCEEQRGLLLGKKEIFQILCL